MPADKVKAALTGVSQSEQTAANMTQKRGKIAAGIKDPAERRAFISKQGEGKTSMQDLDAGANAEQNRQAAMPNMHKGGVVKKDGPVNMKKGEVVRTPEQEKKMKEKMSAKSVLSKGEEKSEPKKEKSAEKHEGTKKAEKKEAKMKHKHTHIEHHEDGSHTVRHTPAEAGAPEVSYSKPDLDGVHDGMEEHLGQPNPGEAEAEAGGEMGAGAGAAAGAGPAGV